jgi:hypothetical protein
MVSQVEALGATVTALDLGCEYRALIAFCEGLAEQIDLHPDRASLWREYRPALERLLVLGDVADDDQASFLNLVRTPVRDPETPGA